METKSYHLINNQSNYRDVLSEFILVVLKTNLVH